MDEPLQAISMRLKLIAGDIYSPFIPETGI